MRRIQFLLSSSSLVSLSLISGVLEQGPPGNRATGVVYELGTTKDGRQLTQASEGATVSILNRDRRDETTSDGAYYLVISDDLLSSTFAVVVKKPGYRTRQSDNYRNDKDPVRIKRLVIQRMEPTDADIKEVIDKEIAIYGTAASHEIRNLIMNDLNRLSNDLSPSDAAYLKHRLSQLPRQPAIQPPPILRPTPKTPIPTFPKKVN